MMNLQEMTEREQSLLSADSLVQTAAGQFQSGSMFYECLNRIHQRIMDELTSIMRERSAYISNLCKFVETEAN
jgi:hypothetical protein